MKKVAFVTFNDMPGGIFSSQVIDVCEFLKANRLADVVLISFVSLRGYFSTRKKIRAQVSSAIVLPMWPGIENWHKNQGKLKRVLRKLKVENVIARGPFATLLAVRTGICKVCFDARAAYAAEFTEFDLSMGKISASEIRKLEGEALSRCNTALAVSGKLVDYWRSNYNYSSGKHVVIPCTLKASEHVEQHYSVHEKIRVVFSGGSGKWQSTELISEYLLPLFGRDPRVELLMLTRNIPDNFVLAEKYPDRVSCKWVDENLVSAELLQCDYGWLVRERNVTNAVASPVKFAEYLNAGLSIIISEELGDFSEFVAANKCGMLVKPGDEINLVPVSAEQKKRNRDLALRHFVKEDHLESYKLCIQ